MFDRAHIWPDFRREWILHEDDDLIFVDKPCGVPTQAADPEEPDDLVTRLSRHLRAQGKAGYLGVHQRLDKDTSGVLVFAKNKDVNATWRRSSRVAARRRCILHASRRTVRAAASSALAARRWKT